MKEKEVKKAKEKEIKKINIHNDEEMRNNGLIRYPKLEPRDESVWTKTDKERQLLRKYKCRK